MIEPWDELSRAWLDRCGQVILLDVNPIPGAGDEPTFALLPPLEENPSGG